MFDTFVAPGTCVLEAAADRQMVAKQKWRLLKAKSEHSRLQWNKFLQVERDT